MTDQTENFTIPTPPTTDNVQPIGNGKHGNLNGGYNSITELPHSSCSSIKTTDKADAMSNIKFIQPKKKKKIKSTPGVSYFKLFRYSTICERFWIVIALICATISSVGMPFNVILYGEFTTLLVDRKLAVGTSTETLVLGFFGGGQQLTNATQEENNAATYDDAVAYGLGTFTITLLQFIFAALSVDMLNATALKQISRIRKLFFKSVLRQDMTWYDLNSGDNFAVKITEDLEKMKEGIGEKLAMCIYLIMSFVVSVVFSFVYGWKLTLVVLSCAPIIIIATAFVAKMQATLSEKELKSYSSAGCVAEEVFGGIRTVVAFGGEDVECERYNARLQPAEVNGNRKGYFTGLGGGVMWFIVYCCYALAFWYGVSLILDDRYLEVKDYTPAVLIIVLFGVLVGAQNLGFTSPHLEAFATARASASSIFSIIERLPNIDSMSDSGLQPEKINGFIEFKDVHFSYPARNDVKVLSGLNLKVVPGQTVALVGESGNGKSTCLHLLQRLYDPMHGGITIDGVNLTDLNVSWLRANIGVVGQEPVLFATSIGENIRYGHPEASQDDIESAAKIANCHTFITKLPNGYDTMVGERGAQLSGGQKQRIAIARALVRNPKILLLDEATSALDMQSERIVQNALDRACAGRTTLVVSHRLSTITNADKIILMSKGLAAEEGTHAELMAMQGLYYDLVISSGSATKKEGISPTTKVTVVDKEVIPVSGDEDSDTESTEIKKDDLDDSLSESTAQKNNVSFWRILKLNGPEWPFIVGGAMAAIITGASFPSFAILFGEMYGILSYPDVEHVRSESKFYSLMFLVLGCVAGLGTFFQTALFNTAGVRLTSRLRQKAFKAMISQEIGWFDDTKNSVGALCARLSGDCAGVQGAIGVRLSNLFQAAATIIIGVSLAFCFSWKLTLVSIIAIPVVIFTVYFESQFMEVSNVKEKEATENATKLAVEAISNIRTVASLGQEPHVVQRYTDEIANVEKACRKKIRLRGVVFAMGQAMPLMGYALALWYGGTLVARGEILYQDVIKVSEALIFGSWMLGQSLAYAPNVGVAMLSASRILKILDRIPKVANRFPKIWNTNVETKGDIVYDDVDFRYPTRPNIPVLQNLNLKIQSGQTVALVGPSGCGKSTCIQLLLRYYDADSGTIEIDEKKTVDYSTYHIRQQMGLVSQEPILFDRTIAENIAYGDNARLVSMTEIIEAARLANIHEFIVNLPKGYETSLGSKGAQLSGGQKQRIAIARALVRNPRILLLDEATSALDNQSEKIVQKALDRAKSGRTCITIAHRLTTIQNADLICVLDSGRIVEQGRHDELMQLGNRYANLYTMQQIES